MEQLRWGIIGCGDVTEKKSGPAFNKVPNSKLVAVMRRNAEKAKDYAMRHNVPKWYSDAQQLIDDPEVNAIYIATPPLQHEGYALKAFDAGKPVYLEKPMTIDAASAERITQAAAKTGMKISIAHYRRQQPRFKKIKELLMSNEVGNVRLVNLQLFQPPQSALIAKSDEFWRVDPAISGGGLFHDLAPHQLDLMLYFFGRYKNAFGFALNQAGLYSADDLVVGNALFENGVALTGGWCFSASPGSGKDLVEIVGSEGKISFSTFATNHFILHKKDKEERFDFDELEHVQQPMIEGVVKYFLDKGPNPCSAQEGVECMRMIDAINGKNAN